MPWTVSQVSKFNKKANTDKLRKIWVNVANAHLDDHPGDHEGAVIRANGVVKRHTESLLLRDPDSIFDLYY